MNAASYYQRNVVRIKRKARRTKLTTAGGKVHYGLNKRPRPWHCELCGQTQNKKGKPIKLDYHHWIENAPQIGIWLCNICHHLAEFLDQETFPQTHNRYHHLKAYAKEQYHLNT